MAARDLRMNEKQNFGRQGELQAANFLIAKGFRILEQNWRFGHLEIDLVCQEGSTIVFVEVKTRKDDTFGGPIGAITERKIRNLSRAADAWIKQHKAWQTPCRFDVVCITSHPSLPTVQHIQDAFPHVSSMDSFNTYW